MRKTPQLPPASVQKVASSSEGTSTSGSGGGMSDNSVDVRYVAGYKKDDDPLSLGTRTTTDDDTTDDETTGDDTTEDDTTEDDTTENDTDKTSECEDNDGVAGDDVVGDGGEPTAKRRKFGKETKTNKSPN